MRVGYAHRSGKSTANSQQACREAVLVLGHRSGRARRTEATVRIRLEKSWLERCTELNLQRTFGPTTMWLGTCWYVLADRIEGEREGEGEGGREREREGGRERKRSQGKDE